MLGRRARPVRRAGTGKPTLETVHGVSSPTQHMELDRHGAELLFLVLTEREEKNSVAIASNESFGGWTKTFTDPRLCAAIVDRLTFNGTIIETGTDSYRLSSTGPGQKSPPRPADSCSLSLDGPSPHGRRAVPCADVIPEGPVWLLVADDFGDHPALAHTRRSRLQLAGASASASFR